MVVSTAVCSQLLFGPRGAAIMVGRLLAQLRDATAVHKFPVLSWMLAGACLCGLAVNELVFVQPARRRLERLEAEEAAALAGVEPRPLPGGAVLMPDGRIVPKERR